MRCRYSKNEGYLASPLRSTHILTDATSDSAMESATLAADTPPKAALSGRLLLGAEIWEKAGLCRQAAAVEVTTRDPAALLAIPEPQ